MDGFFLRWLNASLAAGAVILALVLLRPLLRRGPKWLLCLLWLPAFLRLLPLPSPIRSAASLIPSAQPLRPEILYAPAPAVDSGIPALDAAVNPALSQSLAASPENSVNPVQIVLAVSEPVWLLGAALLLILALAGYFRLRRQVAQSVPLRDNIRLCERLVSPFVLGLFRPTIYLPCTLEEETQRLVLAHEQEHIRRGDPWAKLLGYLLACLHWFNPLVWLAYWLLCRDMELACDEAVLRRLGDGVKKDYSRALLSCAAQGAFFSACPVAFGETGVRQRIRNVLRYRRPGLRLLLPALLLAAALCFGFLADPVSSLQKDPARVTQIDVFDGSTGRAISVTEPEQLRQFVEAMDRLELRRGKLSLGYMGYGYRIRVTGGGGWKQFILNSPDTLRRDPFFYSVTGGEELYDLIAARYDAGAGRIVLVGEDGDEASLQAAAGQWKLLYDEGARHLFLELPYYTAQYLNRWMQAEDDAILAELTADWEGTALRSLAYSSFFTAIKASCPETVFHGVDVGHQFGSTGLRYQGLLRAAGLVNSEDYKRTLEAIAQGREFYSTQSYAYREQIMAENFARDFDALDGETVMGVVGTAHLSGELLPGDFPSLGSELLARYGEQVKYMRGVPAAALRYWEQYYGLVSYTEDAERVAALLSDASAIGPVEADDPLALSWQPMSEDARLVGCDAYQAGSSILVMYENLLLEYALVTEAGSNAEQFAAQAATRLRSVKLALPEALHAGAYDLSLGPGGGFPLLDGSGELLGCLELLPNCRPQWQDGELLGLSLRNHAALTAAPERLAEAAEPCWIAPWQADVYSEELERYTGETQDWWYAFWLREGYEPGFALRLRADRFSRDELAALAASVTIADGAFYEATSVERLEVRRDGVRVLELNLHAADFPLTLYAIPTPGEEAVPADWQCADEGIFSFRRTEDGGCELTLLDGFSGSVTTQLTITYGGFRLHLPVTVST